MDQIFTILGSMGIGGLILTIGLKWLGFIGKKYENAAANMRGDVRAIEAQETLNQNLAETITRMQEQINRLHEQLANERKHTDEWRDRYYGLVAEKASPGRTN